MWNKYGTHDFLEKAVRVHGDKYDYSITEYVNSNTKVAIICPIHGEFWQRAADHLHGIGCKDCGSESSASKRRLSSEEFIAKAVEVHGSKYDYTDVVYTSGSVPVDIVCPIHGIFKMRPVDHTYNGQGCPNCYREDRMVDTDSFIQKAVDKHGDTYDYSLVTYTTSKDKVEIICQYHGIFTQTPSKHVGGQGCPICASEVTNFSGKYHRGIPGLVYYIYFPKFNMWKVGVTATTISTRFSRAEDEYEVIDVIEFDLVKDAYNFETEILRKFSSLRYRGPKLIRDGSTELLLEDVHWYILERLEGTIHGRSR